MTLYTHLVAGCFLGILDEECLSRYSPPTNSWFGLGLITENESWGAILRSGGLVVFCASLGALVLGCFACRDSSSRRKLSEASVPAITKQPAAVATHTFDPVAPPPDMPPLSSGEGAECDSNFLSNASVRGESRQTDATRATVTITQVKMTLQLSIDI